MTYCLIYVSTSQTALPKGIDEHHVTRLEQIVRRQWLGSNLVALPEVRMQELLSKSVQAIRLPDQYSI